MKVRIETTDDKKNSGKLPSRERVELIFLSVNNALVAFEETSGATSHGNKASKETTIESHAERYDAAINVLTGREIKFANCLGVDPDMFFPERGASTREAKEVCRGCVIREACLDMALIRGEKFGIWGGMSERERRRLRRNGIVSELMQIYGNQDGAKATNAYEVTTDEESEDLA